MAAAGGALFLLSDSLIAAGLADWPRPPGHEVWIMLTHAAAQALLAAGVLGAGPPAPHPTGLVPAAAGAAAAGE
jgi:YhhN-like protein